MKLYQTMLAALFVSGLAISLSACDSQEGPMEEAGEEIDESVENAGDAIEDKTDN